MKKNLDKLEMVDYKFLRNMPYHHLVIKPDRITPFYTAIFYDRLHNKYVLYVNRGGNKNNFVMERSPTTIYKLIVSSYDEVDIDLFYPYYWNDEKIKKIKKLNIKNTESKKKIKNTILSYLNILTWDTYENYPKEQLTDGVISV